MYRLKHNRGFWYITCKDWESVVATYYRQWREDDGSIPWTVEYVEDDGTHVVVNMP